MQRFPKKASFAKLDSQETTAIVPKITYHGFCGKCATQAGEAGRTYRQAAENLSDTHSCSLNKGIG